MMNADLGMFAIRLLKEDTKQMKRRLGCCVVIACMCVLLWGWFIFGQMQKVKDNLGIQPASITHLYGYDLPLIFTAQNTNDIVLSEYGDYYVWKGTLTCPECVAVDDVPGDGMHFLSGSGRGYTVLGTESSVDDQRQHIVLRGDDGEAYYIYGLPGFLLNTYTNVWYYSISGEGEDVDTTYSNVVIRIDPNLEFVCKNGKTSTFRNVLHNGYFDIVEGTPSFLVHFGKDGVLDLFAAQ